jgi:hypothetical protein
MFGYNDLGRELNPFLLLDYGGPFVFEPAEKPRGVDRHPHKGFETVTIVYSGAVSHRDSSGGGGTIGPGDVQWMTAGSGILHEEFHSEEFTKTGGLFEMVQLWVNLRAADKGTPAAYQTLTKDAIPTVELDGGSARVIAGELPGAKGPAHTFSPIDVWDVQLRAGARVRLPVKDGFVASALRLGDAALTIYEREGEDIEVGAEEKDARLLVLAAEPIDEPVAGYGPFVMNTMEEISEAFAQFRRG